MIKVPYSVLQIIVPIVLLAGTVLAAMPYAASRKESYEAAARVWVQAQIPNSGDSQTGSGVYMPFMTFFNSPLLTAAEIIKSGEVIHEAGELLKERFPGKKMPNGTQIAGGMSCVPIKDTDILVVKYAGRAPHVAADTLQAVLDAFVQISSRQSSASATKGRAFLEVQMTQAREKLEEASVKLALFQKEHNVSNMQHDIQALMENTEKMRATVQEDQIKINKMQTEMVLLETELKNAPHSTDDSLLAALEKKLGEDRMHLAEMREGLTDDHPYLTRLKDSVDRTIKTLEKARGGALVPAVTKQFLGQEILELRRALGQLEVERRGHVGYLSALEQRLQKLPVDQIEWAELTRHKELAGIRAEEVEKRLQSANLLETVSSGTTNIKIIDKPSVPTLPSGPSKALTLAIASVVGVVLAVAGFLAMRQFNPAITNAAQALAILSWPLAGAVGYGAKAKQSQVERIRRTIKRNLGDGKRLVIVGPTASEGKTQLASSLAMAFAQAGSRVMLIDAAQKGSLHTRFNVPATDGLSDYIIDPQRVNPLKKVANNLVLIPSGMQEAPYDYLTQPATIELLHSLESQVDLMIFDTAANSDDQAAMTLLEQGAIAITVVRLNHTPKNALSALARQFSNINDLRGVVVLTGANEEDLAIAVASKPLATESQTVVAEEQAVW